MHLDASLRRLLPPLAFALAAFYAVLTAYWLLRLRPAYPALGTVWAVNAVGMLVLAFASRKPGSPLWLTSLALAAFPTVGSGLLLLATGSPTLAIAVCITVLGLSLVLVSRWVLLASVAGGFLFMAWSAAAWPAVDWSAALFALGGTGVVAVVAQAMRIRVYDVLEASHRLQLAAETQAQEEQRRRREAEGTARFVRLAAHQLGNPLTSVIIQARRLAQAPFPDEEWRRSAETLDRNVQRLGRVVGDILLVTQHQAGMLALQRERVDLAQLARDAIGALSASDRDRVRASSASQAWAAVDAGKVELALRKLLENALRHTSAAVEVRVAQEGDRVLVAVVDQGPGVAAERRESLFLPDDAMQAGGGGMGLTVCKAVVEAHKGRLTYAPNPVGGSVFTMELPGVAAAPG